MKKGIPLFFGLYFLFMGYSIAQERPDIELVETYLDANGSLNQYEFAYDQLLKMLGEQYPKSEANKQGWDYLERNKENALVEMKMLLIPIYGDHFSKTDLVQMTDFYRSDTGRQLVNDPTKMTDGQKLELNSYYNTEIGHKLIEKRSLLSEAISSASESWSRDLYESAISLLKSER